MNGLSVEVEHKRYLLPLEECRKVLTLPLELALLLAQGTIPEHVVMNDTAYRLRFLRPPQHGIPCVIMRGSRLLELYRAEPTLLFLPLVTGIVPIDEWSDEIIVYDNLDYQYISLNALMI